LIADIKPSVPEYCRINRVIRDIPSTHVVEGNKRTSLRMDILTELEKRGQACHCIRCREVRGRKVSPGHLRLVDHVYHPCPGRRAFPDLTSRRTIMIAGYLRLSLPGMGSGHRAAESEITTSLSIPDLGGAALIREVHVYGQSLPVGGEQQGARRSMPV
jgi:elongator complex protein 3